MGTYAERVSNMMGDDGSTFVDNLGRPLEDLCKVFGFVKEWALVENGNIIKYHPCCQMTSHSRIRYVFPDNSAIVVIGDAWDIEGDKPFSWRGEQ